MFEAAGTGGARATSAQIVKVADRLFYEQGFAATSFADIAEGVGLSRGNFYYHFKAKDDILHAVIAERLANTRSMLTEWEERGHSPADRILSFAKILIVNRAKIMSFGCPVGTLCNELAKLEHHARDEAAAVFTLFREWLGRQFSALGRGDDADALAMHLLMRSQGVATLATAFHDDAFVDREVRAIGQWLDSLANQVTEREAQCSS